MKLEGLTYEEAKKKITSIIDLQRTNFQDDPAKHDFVVILTGRDKDNKSATLWRFSPQIEALDLDPNAPSYLTPSDLDKKARIKLDNIFRNRAKTIEERVQKAMGVLLKIYPTDMNDEIILRRLTKGFDKEEHKAIT